MSFLATLRWVFGFSMVVKLPAKNAFVALLAFEEPSEEDKRTKVRYVVPLYNTLFLVTFHVVLLVWLGEASNPRDTKNHMALGWFLQIIFMLDMACKYAVYGRRGLGLGQFTRYVDVFINTSSFVAMIVLQERIKAVPNGDLSGEYLDDSLTVVIVLQSMRIFKLFFVFNDQNIFEYILPTVLRALFLFSVIYFFSVFAHGFLQCAVRNVSQRTRC